MMKQMKNKFKMSYLPSVSVLFFLLLLDTIVLADYENTWNSYFEQPCCNTNGPHRFRHHKGIYINRSKIKDASIINLPFWPSSSSLAISRLN